MNSCNHRDMWEMNSWITKFVQFCILLLMHTHIFEVVKLLWERTCFKSKKKYYTLSVTVVVSVLLMSFCRAVLIALWKFLSLVGCRLWKKSTAVCCILISNLKVNCFSLTQKSIASNSSSTWQRHQAVPGLHATMTPESVPCRLGLGTQTKVHLINLNHSEEQHIFPHVINQSRLLHMI